MRNLLSFFILFFPALIFGQVVKTAAVPYTKGAGFTPNIAGSSELRVDTTTSGLFWWDRDALTWIRFRPGVDVITGSSAPAYTPRDNQSLFAVNADGELYYFNSPSWVQIGGSGGGGIYGGSGSVPDGTAATLVDDFEFTGPDISSYTVTTGTSTGGQYFQNLAGATVLHRDTSGSSSLAFSGTGALFSFDNGTTDRLTIGGRDVRYSGDYSGTYSARSLIDKGYADGAYIPDSDWTTGFSSATQATSSWTATNAGSNVNAAIVPKGTGAFALAVPDGTTTGGDARGANAVDLQTSRSASTQVASGTRAIVIGGRRNTASGTQAIAIGNINTASGTGGAAFGSSSTASGTNSLALGNAATASASYAVALGGNGAAGPTASGDNSFAVGVGSTASAENTIALGAATASEKNAVALSAFASLYGEVALRGTSFLSFSEKTVTGTSATEIFLDALDTKRALISSGRTWQFEVTVYARASVIGNGSVVIGDMFVATYAGVLRNVGGTTTILGTVQTLMSPQSDATMSDVVFSITADDTNDALKITYTAGASSGTTTQAQVSAVVKICKF